jgi:hypothetical protein
MKLKFVLILFTCCLFSANLLGQKASNVKYEFYYGLGCTNLMADIAVPSDSNKVFWVDFFNTIGYMGNAGLRYNAYGRHYVNINLSLGTLYAYEQTYDVINTPIDKISNTFFTEITGRYEFMIFKERKRETVFWMLGETRFKNLNLPTYLFVGGGCLYNVGNYYQTTPDGRDKILTPYHNFTFTIPYGIGVKTRISSSSYLNLELGLHFVFSDKIDNKEHKNYDQYQFFTVNYIKKLKAKENGLPKF